MLLQNFIYNYSQDKIIVTLAKIPKEELQFILLVPNTTIPLTVPKKINMSDKKLRC